MNTIFDERKRLLLSRLHHLALHHNRDYYVSMIPIIELLIENEMDLLESYQQVIDEEHWTLFHSKQAFNPIGFQVQSLISL